MTKKLLQPPYHQRQKLIYLIYDSLRYLEVKMRKVSVILIAVFMIALLSSCSMHLSKIFGGNSSNASQVKPVKTKHVKATHTPPSPQNPAATPGAVSSPTPSAYYGGSTNYQPGTQSRVAFSITQLTGLGS